MVEEEVLCVSSLGEKTLAVVRATVLIGELSGMGMTVSPDDSRQPATAMPAMDRTKMKVLRSRTPSLPSTATARPDSGPGGQAG